MKSSLIVFFTFFLLTTLTQASTREGIRLMTMKNHHALEYAQVKKLLFSIVDNIKGQVCSAYTPSQCKERYQRDINQALDSKSHQNFKLNIEHTWPQSKGAKELPANSDMHHLFVTSKESNSKRANLPFCDAVYDYWQMDGSIQGFDNFSQDCFEAQDLHKGNVARAMFYFSIRYNYPIDSHQESVLRSWHELDPVDQREIERNLIIQKLQGNLNPFITDPNFVNLIKDF
ncbi:endonuclease I family protein [Halobacteriovorax sp. HLS]|uniref:endonuclease I family protein n=1 Tax=Halobacteriovorax sp. HLS TaxID=2234000 RepID=UPI000FD72ECA|nr:endonuclease [Halobacteriovorax sp. HLS]